jgi:hypothetical protein
MTPQALKARTEALKTERSNINGDWEEIGRLVVPGRGRMYETHDDENSITRDFPDKYDSTAVVASQSLAAALHSGLTSPATDWFGLRFKSQKLNDDTTASAWLQACQEQIFDTIQESNFNLEVNEIYLDITSFGTTIMLHEYDPDDGSFNFRASFPRENYFEEDFNGNLIGIYRERQYTAQQLMLKFPTKCPKEIREQGVSTGSANQKYTVIHVVRLNEDNKENLDAEGILAAEKRPFEERYILAKDATELTEDVVGYYEMPGYAVRWGRMSGSKFGFSPALNALPDIRTLNTLVSQVLDAAAKVIDPAIMTMQRGIIGDIDLAPGGETIVRDMDAMKPFESGARFDVSQLIKGDLVESIRKAFYIDQLELPMTDRMTATEVQVRYEQMQRLLGPALFRIQSDFLDPLIRRSFNILFRDGKLPDMPQIILDTEGEFEVEYLGPLARSQKMGAVNAFQQLMTIMERVAPIKPEVVDAIEWTDAFQDMALRMGVPAKYLKSDAKLKEDADVRKAQQAEAGRMAKAESMAASLKDGAAAAKMSTEAEAMGGPGGMS